MVYVEHAYGSRVLLVAKLVAGNGTTSGTSTDRSQQVEFGTTWWRGAAGVVHPPVDLTPRWLSQELRFMRWTELASRAGNPSGSG